MTTPDARDRLAAASTVVVKVGTAVLTNDSVQLDRAYLHDLAAHVAALCEGNARRVILVSSGAVGAGLGAMSRTDRPTDVTELQAAAATGQPLLMQYWHEAFGVRSLPVAQILVGRGDFDSRERYLNIRNCLSCLHDKGIVPIVNENDSVATDEISLGDNDVLAAKLAIAVRADALVVLTTVDGVLDEEGRTLRQVDDADALLVHVRAERSRHGRGGMLTKVEAARLASQSGVDAIIAAGRPAETLPRLFRGEDIGTLVPAQAARHLGRRQWISQTATPSGVLHVDAGAARALAERGASLLAKGITQITGRFGVGDVISIHDPNGREIARGLTNLSSDELRVVQGRNSAEFEELLGRRAHEEAVHRDNLAITI
ncbi:MAG: glutamate 5-kinase [Planctomycetota bacterium]